MAARLFTPKLFTNNKSQVGNYGSKSLNNNSFMQTKPFSFQTSIQKTQSRFFTPLSKLSEDEIMIRDAGSKKNLFFYKLVKKE